MNYLGIDLGGTQMRGVVVDEQGQVLVEDDELTNAQEGREAVLTRLLNFMGQFVEKMKIEAIGIGTPGPIDYVAGSIINTPNLPLEKVALRQIIEEKFGLPVAMDRDANATLIGEHWRGEARGLKNVVMLTWGTGVGGAIIIENKIYRGQSDLAGEIGHMIIDENGPQCRMGHRGCLESLIGGRALFERYGKSLKELAAGARSGKAEEQKIMAEVGEALAVGLKNIVTLFDPEMILIDGSGAMNMDLMLDYVKDLPVKVSQFAKKAGVMGAARIAMERAMN